MIAEATHSRRTWITPHVLRYQCITNSQKGNVDRITAKRVAGDITDQMWSKYSHVRLDSTREKTAEAFQDIMPPRFASIHANGGALFYAATWGY